MQIMRTHRLKMAIGKFIKDKSGNSAIMLAITLPVLLGFIGMSTDVALWYWEDRKLQSTTDSAALAAGYEKLDSGDISVLTAKVQSIVNETYPGSDNVSVISVSSPPTSGNYSGNSSAVEVIVANQQGRYFSVLNMDNDVNLRSRAVAQVVSSGDFCLLGLSEEEDRAVNIQGNATVSLNCGIAVNSNSDEALYVNGTVTTTYASTVGGLRMGGSGTINSPSAVVEKGPSVADPYGPDGLNLSVPAPSACDFNNHVVKKNATLNPGRYCGGLKLQKGTTTLNPGVYVIDGGEFRTTSQANVQGEGVTIILTGSGNDYANLEIHGGSDFELSAPEKGSGADYEGILMYQDRNAPMYQGSNLKDNKINGGSNLNLRGVMYFPQQQLTFNGGATVNIKCLQMIAQAISFSGNADVTNECEATDAREEITIETVRLVE